MSDPVVCTIGATDPWNAAGLGLDLRILDECRVRAVWIVAGVTAQDADGLHASHPVPPAMIHAQFDALERETIDAYRVGAILEVAGLDAIASRLRIASAPIVYDPVAGPSRGGRFIDTALRDRLLRELLPQAALVTPNLDEAQLLTGLAPHDVESMIAAGNALLALGARAALIKGGHLTDRAADVLVDPAGVVVFDDERIAGTMRGTGCVLADAVAAGLAYRRPLREAVADARALVRAKLRAVVPVAGMSLAPRAAAHPA